MRLKLVEAGTKSRHLSPASLPHGCCCLCLVHLRLRLYLCYLFVCMEQLHFMNPPREGKALLVLDLDHTLLDFTTRVRLTMFIVGLPSAV